MTLVRTSNLPAFDRLAAEGLTVMTPEQAEHQDIRELHFGIVNIMPDAALEATERQFMRLIEAGSGAAQIHTHLTTLPLIERSASTAEYIKTHYKPIEELMEEGLDGLIVTGANVTLPASDIFWKPVADVVDWSHDNVTSTMCSCFASHIVMAHRYGVSPVRHNTKRWGVFPHRLADPSHPLVRNLDTKFDVPHSRFGEVRREDLFNANMRILIDCHKPWVGVHSFTSPDGFRIIGMQGHPEYDSFSLLKEFTREVGRYLNGERDFPETPENYLENSSAINLISDFSSVTFPSQDKDSNRKAVKKLEDKLMPHLEVTWRGGSNGFFSNWVSNVYKVTNVERNKPFMNGVDPTNPLGIDLTPPQARPATPAR
jgi:homoserine O-succinyltransferase